jgi:hypothetical protein
MHEGKKSVLVWLTREEAHCKAQIQTQSHVQLSSLMSNVDRAIAQVVSRRLPTAVARFDSRSDHVDFLVEKVALG